MRAALIAVIVSLAHAAGAAPSEEFKKGQEAFRNQDCDTAIPTLNNLVRPVPKLGDKDQLVETYVMLGTCRFRQNDRVNAKVEFDAALQLQPDRVLVVNAFYSEGAVRLFDETKDDRRKRAEADEKAREDEKYQHEIDEFYKNAVIYEQHSYKLNFVPFGIPQFSQDRTRWGVVFAGTQAATFGTAVGLGIYLANKYGFPRGKVPIEEADSVFRLQQLQVGSALLFVGFYAWGVYDALKHYQPRTFVKADETLLPARLRNRPSTKPPKGSFRLIPMLLPNGGGIGMAWEN